MRSPAELEEAACFFKIAGQGSGRVYDVPGELFGGSDVPVSKGDSEIVAAFALLGAAAGHLAWVHEIDLPLGRVICDSGDPAATPCYDDQTFASRFNSAFASKFHPGRMLIVERLVAEALPLLDRGIADLDANSLLARTAISSPGLDALRTMVQAAFQSIQNGTVALPHVTPALSVNFKALFESPRNPKNLGVPPLLYSEECDVDYCWTSTELDIRFVERYFEGRINADWENGSYDWSDDDCRQRCLRRDRRAIAQVRQRRPLTIGIPCSARFVPVLLAVAVSACGDAETQSRLDVDRDDDGAVTKVTATWNYRSGEVDVDLTLTTDYSDMACVTTAHLWVNEVAATPDIYRLEATECALLALTEHGDIVLRESPTDHDWSTEPLNVDTGSSRLELGPWTAAIEGALSYHFILHRSGVRYRLRLSQARHAGRAVKSWF